MSILLDAEKLRRKLEKLDAKRDKAIAAARAQCEASRFALLAETPAPVLALVQSVQSADSLTETSDSRIGKHLDQIDQAVGEFRKELAQ